MNASNESKFKLEWLNENGEVIFEGEGISEGDTLSGWYRKPASKSAH